MSTTITASASITIDPVRLLPPAPPHTYLGIAHSMINGVRILANASPTSGPALALVAGHVLECTLKAYLSREGDDSAVKNDRAVRHDVAKLWSMAHSQGLRVPLDMPSWAATLALVHGAPFYLRYSTGVHGIVVPASEPMASELQALLALVQTAVAQT